MMSPCGCPVFFTFVVTTPATLVSSVYRIFSLFLCQVGRDQAVDAHKVSHEEKTKLVYAVGNARTELARSGLLKPVGPTSPTGFLATTLRRKSSKTSVTSMSPTPASAALDGDESFDELYPEHYWKYVGCPECYATNPCLSVSCEMYSINSLIGSLSPSLSLSLSLSVCGCVCGCVWACVQMYCSI